MLRSAQQQLGSGISKRKVAKQLGISDACLRKRLLKIARADNSEAPLQEEEHPDNDTLPVKEDVDISQTMRVKEEILDLEDFVDLNKEAFEEVEQDVDSSFCKSAVGVNKSTLPSSKENSSNGNSSTYVTQLNSVVSKLERVSDQIAAAMFGDSYDQFGKYIATLLRGLPRKTVISLKQQIVQAVLTVKFAQEQDKSIPDTPSRPESTSAASDSQNILDITDFIYVNSLKDNSASQQNLEISENISTNCTDTSVLSGSSLPTASTTSTSSNLSVPQRPLTKPESNSQSEVTNVSLNLNSVGPISPSVSGGTTPTNCSLPHPLSSTLTSVSSSLSTITGNGTNSPNLTAPQTTPDSSRTLTCPTLLISPLPIPASGSTPQLFTLNQQAMLASHCLVPTPPNIFLYGSLPNSSPAIGSSTEAPKRFKKKRTENPKTYSKKAKLSNANMCSDINFPVEIEEGTELADMKKEENSFETVYCGDPLPELKQEPPDEEEDHLTPGNSPYQS